MQNKDLFDYVLRLADTSLIYGQRISEWCGHGPVLEEDIALSNTALDYLGQATNLFKYAAEIEGGTRDEDQIAFVRDLPEYRNLLMVELPNGDYAVTIARHFLFSQYYFLFLEQLQKSGNEFLSGFAQKSIKEVRYHLEHSSNWVKRMGDGTEESHNRIQKAINQLWEYTGEFFDMDELDTKMLNAGIGVDNASLKTTWRTRVEAVATEATLSVPADGWHHSGSKSGKHTEHLGYILAEMQYLQRTFPNAKW